MADTHLTSFHHSWGSSTENICILRSRTHTILQTAEPFIEFTKSSSFQPLRVLAHHIVGGWLYGTSSTEVIETYICLP